MEGQEIERKRRRSKKTKKGWRKYTDVRDVEEFLEDQRNDERTGGPVSEKVNDELFFVEKEGESKDGAQRRLQRRRYKLRSLRSEANLLPPAVKRTMSSRDRKREEKRERLKKLKTEPDSQTVSGEYEEVPIRYPDSSSDEEQYDHSIRYAQIRQQQDAAVTAMMEQRLRKPIVRPVMRDLWADPLEPDDIPDDHYLRVTRKKPVKKPVSMKEKPSLLKAVEVPPPGASYNPTFEDHQELLRSAVGVEEGKVRAAEKLEKRMKLTPMDHHQRERVWLEEMSEGLFAREGEGEEEEEWEEEGGEHVAKRPIRAEDRKLRKQRRKERERKEEEKKKMAEKAEKTRMGDVYRLRSIKKEIAMKEADIVQKEKERLEAEGEAMYTTRRLGKQVYQEPDIDLQLCSEISGALRTLKPEGNVAMDVFKSLQRRNIIEPRERVRPFHKYKLKIKEKRTARLPEEGPFY